MVGAVEASRDGLEALLRELIAFRTESQAKEAEHFPEEARRCIAYVGDFLRMLGFEVEGWDVGPSATFDAHPLIVARLPGSGAGARSPSTLTSTLCRSATAARGRRPVRRRGRRRALYGRGATNMKGGLAAALWAT